MCRGHGGGGGRGCARAGGGEFLVVGAGRGRRNCTGGSAAARSDLQEEKMERLGKKQL